MFLFSLTAGGGALLEVGVMEFEERMREVESEGRLKEVESEGTIERHEPSGGEAKGITLVP